MKISILIPAHNEEKSIRICIDSCLNQSRIPDEIVVVNDGSTDKTAEILASFGEKIKVISGPEATGNKSFAQEIGLSYVSGEVLICTDADTVLDKKFVELIEKDFIDPELAAVAGYVRSLKYNWLTACRALDYVIGQNIYKLAQSYINFIFVIPGAAGAYRTEIFKKYVTFDHDTVTEDLDFTYKFNKKELRIKYDREAIVYTQDPPSIKSYINQMRRWYGGGWQNLIKHFRIIKGPAKALELSLMYIEGLVFSLMCFLIPLVNIRFELYFISFYFLVIQALAIYAAIKEKRVSLLYVSLPYLLLVFINAWIFLEQFFNEVIFKKKNLIWLRPDRFKI
jgi:cellulose synthase/poly-beta-1,6-N-acetylglucosamine synthase-like glycosyltransferase